MGKDLMGQCLMEVVGVNGEMWLVRRYGLVEYEV